MTGELVQFRPRRLPPSERIAKVVHMLYIALEELPERFGLNKRGRAAVALAIDELERTLAELPRA